MGNSLDAEVLRAAYLRTPRMPPLPAAAAENDLDRSVLRRKIEFPFLRAGEKRLKK